MVDGESVVCLQQAAHSPEVCKEMAQEVTSTAQLPTRNTAAQDLRARIADVIGPVRCDLWFGEADRIEFREEEIRFLFENEFEANRVQKNFGSLIRRIVDSVSGPGCRIVYAQLAAANPAINSPADRSARRNSSTSKNSAAPQKTKFEQHAAQPPLNAVAGAADGSAFESGPHSAGHAAERHAAERHAAERHAAEPTVQTFERSFAGTSAAAPPGRAPVAKTLDRFWFGSENELAQAAVNQTLQHPGSFSPLFFFGPCGSGKSHLLEGLCQVFREKMKLRRCVWLTAEEFTNSFIDALRGSGLPMFRKKFRDLDLLAIDDIQFLAGKRATVTELQYTLDQLARNGKQVILAADRSPSELALLSPELAARVAGGLNCPLRYPELTGRRQILAWMCEQRGFPVPIEVLQVLAQGVTRDCRRLSGALNRLRASWLTNGATPTPDTARRDLADLLNDPRPTTTLPRIEQVVCDACGVSAADLRSESRTQRISSARMLAMWLSRQFTSSALSEIGEYFGGRSHSTVVAAQKRIDQWMQSDRQIEVDHARYQVRDAIQMISRKLRVG